MDFRDRFEHRRTVLFKPGWAFLYVVLLGAPTALLTWRDELLPENLKDEWRVLKMLPHWDWGWWALGISALIILIILESSFRVNRRLKGESSRPPLQILYDIADDRFVREIPGLHGSTGEWFWVGLHNRGKQTLRGVELRAHESQFVECTIAEGFPRSTINGPVTVREPIIRTLGNLDPGKTDMVQVFGISYSARRNAHDILAQVQRFTLEATARDTPNVTAVFEYNPDRRPIITQCD
jgi:hypothetical protein